VYFKNTITTILAIALNSVLMSKRQY
jgi:hypothetical protein